MAPGQLWVTTSCMLVGKDTPTHVVVSTISCDVTVIGMCSMVTELTSKHIIISLEV